MAAPRRPRNRPAEMPTRSALAGARAAAGGNKPRVYGTAGASVGDAGTKWANNREVVRHGRDGERKTAAALERGLGRGPVIMHDLRIPIPGFKANIDHLVVSDNVVTVIDAKSWAGGFYWTSGGKTRRGLARFEPAEKQTMILAAKAIRSLLDRAGVEAEMNTPVVAVWSTSGRASLWAAKFPGALLINGEKLQRSASHLCGRLDADPDVVEALTPLVL